MQQQGNIFTGKFRDMPNYLTRQLMYYSYDTKELYGFDEAKLPFNLFDQDNETRVIRIPSEELPEPYTKEDVKGYLNGKGINKDDIETLVIEVTGGELIGEGSYGTSIRWENITNKPIEFNPSPHTHDYDNLTNKPNLDSSRFLTEDQVKQIVTDFTVGGDNIEIIYDEVNDVLKFNVTSEIQENINIVIDIPQENLISSDRNGVEKFLNNLDPPLLIEPQHNIYINVVSSISTNFEYPFNVKLA